MDETREDLIWTALSAAISSTDDVLLLATGSILDAAAVEPQIAEDLIEAIWITSMQKPSLPTSTDDLEGIEGLAMQALAALRTPRGRLEADEMAVVGGILASVIDDKYPPVQGIGQELLILNLLLLEAGLLCLVNPGDEQGAWSRIAHEVQSN